MKHYGDPHPLMNMPALPLALFLFLVMAVVPARALTATESSPDFARGRELFLAGDHQGALPFLDRAFRADPANATINFYLGRAAFESGDYETALMAFERVLIMDPGATRVKLEMARCHMRLGSREIAKQYFREVLATNPPEPVWNNIARYLDTLEELDRDHIFTGTFTLGAHFDDNVYLSPTSDVISLDFIDLTLTGPSARPRNDRISTSTLVLNHLYRIREDRLSWKTTLLNYNALYDDHHELDIAYYGLTSGPVWKSGPFIWNNHVLLKYTEVEHDRYLSSAGLGTAFTMPLTPWGLITVSGRLEEKNHYRDPLRDATTLLFSVNPVFNLGTNRISLLFYKEAEEADAAYWSYDRHGAFLRYDRSLPLDLNLYGGIGLKESEYDGPDPFFGVTRSDSVHEIQAGLSRLLWRSPGGKETLSGQLGYVYLDADSNIDIYTYRKNVFSLSLTLGF